MVDNEPLDLLTMEYKLNHSIMKLDYMGKVLTPTQVQDHPFNLYFEGCNLNKLYTIIMTDIDEKYEDKHQWVHYVKINVSGNDLTNSGDIVMDYVGSGPAEGSGLHRYVWLVF